MKKIFAILAGLLFLISTFAVASVMAPPPIGIPATYISPNKMYYSIGENVVVTSDGEYDALETPNGLLSYVGSVWDDPKLTMTWKAEKSGTVEFYNENTSVIIKIGIARPTPMQQFMKILGLGKKD